jgi:phosphoglycerate dehydrogenase-like enzyme
MTILSGYYLDESENGRIAQAIAPMGGRLIYGPEELQARIDLVEEHIAEADILLGGRLTEGQWGRAGKLKWIHVPWAGVNSLLTFDAIRNSPIPITNSSGVMSDSVADQAMGLILMLNRDLHAQVRAQERRQWSRYELESPKRQILRGKTIGIAGYGAIGREIALRARGFGMRVAALRQDLSNRPPEVDALYSPDQLHSLLEVSDVVVIALPLTERTTGLFGAEEFRRMKRSAYLVNIARGAVVNEGELIEALRSGEIAGAGLDVFQKEPLPEDSPFWEMENVVVTPHSAGGYRGFRDAVVDLFLENLRRYNAGQPLLNLVRKEEGY